MKKTTSIILLRGLTFILFLILLAIANQLAAKSNSTIFTDIINFFNANLILLSAIMIIGAINEIFWNFSFPLNLSAPITSSVFSIFLISLIYKAWVLYNSYLPLSLQIPLKNIYIIIPSLVLICGYIIILIRQGKLKHEKKNEKQMPKKDEEENIKWKNIGNEFKLVFYNIGKSINRLFKRKPKKKHQTRSIIRSVQA